MYFIFRKENYDLCCTCFGELQGSFADYIRIDKPTILKRPFNMACTLRDLLVFSSDNLLYILNYFIILAE